MMTRNITARQRIELGIPALPPGLAALLDGNTAPVDRAPRTHLSERRRVERALPPRIAYRITSVVKPTTADDRILLREAKTVFRLCWREIGADLTTAEMEAFEARLNRVQRELLDQYDGRGAMTVYAAAHHWLQDIHNRGAYVIDQDGPFYQCWEKLGEALAGVKQNMDAWDGCQRSAAKMYEEWRRWFEARRYYLGSV